MSGESNGPMSSTAILLGGGVREALMAQPVIRACEGATVFASSDGVGTLLGLPSVGRAVVFDDSPVGLASVFQRIRTGSVTTAVLPYPAALRHAALLYFAGVPRRLVFPGVSDWTATQRLGAASGQHPVEVNWRLALGAGKRPMRAAGGLPRLEPPDAVRSNVLARWSGLFSGGRRPLMLIPGRGGWSPPRPGPLWPAERYAVVANQSTSDRIVLLSGKGDERAVRETRAGIAKATTVINLVDLTVEELAAIGELSVAVIGHDGDALHVAAAAGALVLAIIGRSDIAPMAERVAPCVVEDYERFPAREVLKALQEHARVDSYA
jgi:ADP-heptose:LPS heptosyltransferase